jgi:biopolymer transport protein ExbD
MAFEMNEQNDEIMNEINMTPLVDVMLVLLIIFIITLPIVQHAVKVELPHVNSTQQAEQPEALQLAINAQGQYFLGTSPVAAEALESMLRPHASRNPPPALHIRGDKAVAYQYIAEAMGAAHRAGIANIGFVSTPKP